LPGESISLRVTSPASLATLRKALHVYSLHDQPRQEVQP